MSVEKAVRYMVEKKGKKILANPAAMRIILEDLIPEDEKTVSLLVRISEDHYFDDFVSHPKSDPLKQTEYILNQMNNSYSEKDIHFVRSILEYTFDIKTKSESSAASKKTAVKSASAAKKTESSPKTKPGEDEPKPKKKTNSTATTKTTGNKAKTPKKTTAKSASVKKPATVKKQIEGDPNDTANADVLVQKKKTATKKQSVEKELLVIPGNVRNIKQSKYRSNQTIKKVIIPGTVETIGRYAFINCPALEEVEIHEGVREIASYAFKGCPKLARITIADSVSRIGDHAFKDCINLKVVDLPESLKILEESVFEGCTGLVHLNVKSGVKILNRNAMKGCTSLNKWTVINDVWANMSFRDKLFTSMMKIYKEN